MFNNAGKKVKTVAKVVFCLNCILTLISWISLLLLAIHLRSPELVIISTLLLPIAIIFAWVFSLLIYAFGQLVDNSDKLAENKEEKEEEEENVKFTDF